MTGFRPPARDPGLPAERTRLAWRRTGLTATVVAVLTVRLALTGGRVGALLAALTVLCWGATVTLCQRRAAATDLPGSGGRTLAAVSLCAVGLALIGTLLVVHGV
ncbi:DUF202 domain-containing protein [Micromonospora radicis]|uniref:DUF202 domain-containing protein n=1 Tax=Micromonospora radicis TaxID=1894971 RepID=A0A418N0A7_9ACTN|nr:DUF202 domain-containing protein [Micromonospora radicis]RIV40606.1 DUF202 domain-containing protein [Micromonospora radicis]